MIIGRIFIAVIIFGIGLGLIDLNQGEEIRHHLLVGAMGWITTLVIPMAIIIPIF